MLGRIFAILFFIVTAALQTTLGPQIAVLGVKPDFLLITVVVWAIIRGPREGGVVGISAGLIEDVISANLYIQTFTKAAAGVFSGFVGRNLGSRAGMIYVLTVAIVTPMCYIMEILAFYFFFGRQLPGLYSVVLVMVLSSIYNALLTLVLYIPLSRFLEMLSFGEKTKLKEYKLYRM